MKKNLSLALILTFSFCIAYAQTNWASYHMSGKLSVKFPAQPTPIAEGSVIFKEKDSTVYIASVVNLAKREGADSSRVAAEFTNKEDLNSFKEGFLSQLPGFTFGDMTAKKWNNNLSYTLDGENPVTKLKFYMFMVVDNVSLNVLMIIVPESHKLDKKDSFFNSLAFN